MQHMLSESDLTSLAPSSPTRSPKRPVYYVESPSRSSQDGGKFSLNPTPVFNSPMESPMHPSTGQHSRNSSSGRFSGIFRSTSARKMAGKRNEKGWPECEVIVEEGNFDEFQDDERFRRRCQGLMALLSFFVLFSVFCLIIWGAARTYRAEVTVKSLVMNNFYMGVGADFSGVPTKMLTMNCSLLLSIYNPASFFGIHVSSTPLNVIYSDITVATGQLQKYYQPRNSRRAVLVNLKATKVPLYGAGSSLEVSDKGFKVPVVLEFHIRSRGEVVGKLVTTNHRRHISCPLVIDSTTTKPIKFKKDSCIIA